MPRLTWKMWSWRGQMLPIVAVAASEIGLPPSKASPAQDLGSHMAAALSVGLSPAPQPCPIPSPLSWYCCLSLWCTVLPTLPRALEPAWVFREENSRKQVIDKAIFYFVINIWNTVSKLHLKVYCKENLNVPCK